MIDTALRAAARLVVRRPGGTAGLLVLVTLGAAALLPRFEIESDVAAMFPPGHESVELFEATQLGDKTARTLYVALRGTELESHLPAVLAELGASPFLTEVAGTRESLGRNRAEAARSAPLYQLPPDVLDRLEERLSPEGRRAAVAESLDLMSDPLVGPKVVSADPLGLRWLLDEGARRALPENFDPDSPYLLLDGGRLAFVRLTGARDPYDLSYSLAVLADVEARLAKFDGLAPTLVGGYATARADAARIRGDLVSSIAWSLPLIFVFLALSMRSLKAPVLVVVPIALAVFWALAYGGYLLGPLTPLATGAAAILTGLGVDFTIHYLGRFREERTRASYGAAIETTHVHTGRALFAGTVTTVVAFLSVAFGSFPGLRTFGLLLALGLGLGFAATLLLLPLLLRRTSGASANEARLGVVPRAALGLAFTGAGKPVAWALLALSAWGWLLVPLRGLNFDADPTRLRPDDEPLVEAARELRGELGFSPIPLLALVPTGAAPILADAVHALTEGGWVRFADGAHAVLPSADQRARVAAFRERTGGWLAAALDDFARAGFRREAFEGVLGEQAELFRAEPAAPELAGPRLAWRGTDYFLLTLYPVGALSDASRRAALHAAAATAFGDGARIVDPYSLADDLAPLLARDLTRALSVCGVVIAGLVIWIVGRPRAGFLALVPVLAGLGITLGGLAWLRMPLHPGNFMAIPLILGLGVDDGIHMVLRSREADGASGLAQTVAAVWRTSVTTALGFGSLVLAESPAIASLGGIVLVGVLVCFLASVWILPAFLGARR